MIPPIGLARKPAQSVMKARRVPTPFGRVSEKKNVAEYQGSGSAVDVEVVPLDSGSDERSDTGSSRLGVDLLGTASG